MLQTGEVERVGSSRAHSVNARIVSATNVDLHAEVGAGRFREDLLFRLNTIEIHLPPVRERREDIPALAMHFLKRHADRYQKSLSSFDAAAMQALLDHSWPGNIRELDHAIERAVLLAQGAASRYEELTLEEAERVLIQKALTRYDGNVSQAAKALGLSRSALYRRLSTHGL